VLQQIVRQILIENQLDPFTAAVIVSALPVLVMYPFLLRYFEKGTMIGSVKE